MMTRTRTGAVQRRNHGRPGRARATPPPTPRVAHQTLAGMVEKRAGRPGRNTPADTASRSTMVTGAGDATSNMNATAAKGPIPRLSAQVPRAEVQKGGGTATTPIKVGPFGAYLTGYDKNKADYLISGLTKGFFLESEGLTTPRTEVANPPISRHLAEQVRKKLYKEIDAGCVKGPFKSPPLPNFRVSPIKVTEKKEPGTYRFIHNLSYPYEESVNASIPREKVAVQYNTIDDGISYIKLVGRGAHLAKTAIKSAFRIIPVHPSQYHLLGMKWEGNYSYDTMLPMGCSISCAIFEAFFSAMEWVAKNKLGIPYMTHVLDDFLILPFLIMRQDASYTGSYPFAASAVSPWHQKRRKALRESSPSLGSP